MVDSILVSWTYDSVQVSMDHSDSNQCVANEHQSSDDEDYSRGILKSFWS